MTIKDIEMFADSQPNPEEWKQFCIEVLNNARKQGQTDVLELFKNTQGNYFGIFGSDLTIDGTIDLDKLKETTDEMDN